MQIPLLVSVLEGKITVDWVGQESAVLLVGDSACASQKSGADLFGHADGHFYRSLSHVAGAESRW